MSNKQPPVLFPFGDAVEFRPQAEKINDEVYRSIPALNHLATTTLTVTNKISQDARNALLLDDGKVDPEMRVLKVELGMVKRDQMESAQPDLDYMHSAAPAGRRDFESPENDAWLSPN